VLDAADSPLHVVGYSVPVDATMPLAALRPHLHSLPDRPGLVPYRTSYWEETWGLCLAHEVLEGLPDGEYRVRIDADLRDGALTYGECVVPGTGDGHVLVSTPVCHPALANDNLSGVALLGALAARLLDGPPPRRTHHVVWGPGTLGPLAWLRDNAALLPDLVGGAGVMCAGDRGPVTWKRTRRGDSPVDRAMLLALRDAGVPHVVRDFTPWGGDERQYASPGFALDVGALSRTPPGEYPENHTSADDMSVVDAARLEETLDVLHAALTVLDRDASPRNLSPYGEPQLGRRGLTRRLGGQKGGDAEMALFWVLNLSDGTHTLMDVAERSGLPFAAVHAAADDLRRTGLLG
jgi:aminopeptidase-like protein